MFTPQDIEKVSFDRATFGGYNIEQVDEFLEPLTEYYVTLYKENALLKSKMRVLVGKLEEYRENEDAMKDAMADTQRACDRMVRETEQKCAQMLSDANRAAAENARNATNLIAEEKARVDDARRLSAAKISELQLQLSNCLEMLERIKAENRPSISRQTRGRLFDANAEKAKTGALADEISHNLEAMIRSADDSDMKVVSRK